MTEPAETVGMVGLGAMGSEIAGALLDAGYPVTVCDTNAAVLEPAVERGAKACRTARDVADRAAIVLVSLPTPSVVRQVAAELAPGEAIEVFVDLSTTGAVAREIAAILADVDVGYLDSPLTGGVPKARTRDLTVLAAGEPRVFDRIRPLLETFGEVVLHVGATPGQGQTAKVLNNLLSATALAATSEVMTLGRRAGLEPEVLLEGFNAGSGQNTATSAKFPNFVLDRSFDSNFRMDLMLKDVRLCLDEARALGHPMVLGSIVEQLWGLAAEEADPEADHTEIVRLFERWSGVEVRATRTEGDTDA